VAGCRVSPQRHIMGRGIIEYHVCCDSKIDSKTKVLSEKALLSLAFEAFFKVTRPWAGGSQRPRTRGGPKSGRKGAHFSIE